MTLEEKVNLLVGVGAWNGNDIAQEIKDAKNLIPGCAGQTYPIPRLGIPSVMLPDGPGGLRINPTRQNDEKTYYCTSFPVATVLAQSWNQYGSNRERCAVICLFIILACGVDTQSARTVRQHN